MIAIGSSSGVLETAIIRRLRGCINVIADFRKPLTLLISTHLRALSVPTFGVIVELRGINAGTDNSIHGGSYAR